MQRTKKKQSTVSGTPQQPVTGVVTIPTFTVNGRNIVMTYEKGHWYVAVKPICEILNVDYTQQFKNLKEDENVGQLLCNHTTVGADSKQRKMVCIPERFVYGWLFSIKSSSPELREYKIVCHDVLFDYFRGSYTEREPLLKQHAFQKRRMKELSDSLKEDPRIIELNQLKYQMRITSKQLNVCDEIIEDRQMSLWLTETKKEVTNDN